MTAELDDKSGVLADEMGPVSRKRDNVTVRSDDITALRATVCMCQGGGGGYGNHDGRKQRHCRPFALGSGPGVDVSV